MLTSNRWPRPILCVVWAMTLASCASSPGELKVKLTDECLRLGGTVAPPDIDASTDYRKLSADALAKLNRANRGSAARTRCERKVIDNYANAK